MSRPESGRLIFAFPASAPVGWLRFGERLRVGKPHWSGKEAEQWGGQGGNSPTGAEKRLKQ